MARKRKMKAKELAEKVERYFASITRTVTVTERVPTDQLDDHGHTIYKTVPVINSLGEEAKREEYIEPPSVQALCLFLKIDESTWSLWCDEEKYPEFFETTTRARGRMKAWLVAQSMTRKDVKGIIFNLQNNYGYSEKKQVELGPNAARVVSAQNMGLDEKRALLEEIAQEFGDHP